ncbi:MAG: TldD/PmbA family protein [Actinomycetota bacterium]
MPGLIGEEAFAAVAAAALELEGADGVEVLFMHEWAGNTRFASSQIHQSTAREDTSLRVRVIRDGRIGVASTNDFSSTGAGSAGRSALEMTGVVSPDPSFPGLAPPADIPAATGFDEATAATSPAQRAAAVAEVIASCGDRMHAAGAYETTAMELGIANTQGQRCWAPITQAQLNAVITGPDGGNGFAESITPRVEDVDPGALGAAAASKAVASTNPRPIEPGTYEVVLEPAASSTLLEFLAYLGLGGKGLLEGESCLAGRQGQRVADESITIFDDATDPHTVGPPFDFEGVPKRRVDLIRDGMFVDGVYDLRTAKQANTTSTGHGLPAPNPDGPFPLNLFLEPGTASVDEMIAATGRGLLVTRFHYTNVVHPIESTITGMTRDGTFLIEDGKIVGPVHNLRFTQSVLGALSDVSMVGRDTALASEFFFAASCVPALKIDRFTFSSTSDH